MRGISFSFSLILVSLLSWSRFSSGATSIPESQHSVYPGPIMEFFPPSLNLSLNNQSSALSLFGLELYFPSQFQEEMIYLNSRVIGTPMPISCSSCSVASRVWLFVTPTAARQASPSFTISRSLLKLMSTESTVPSNHVILCAPLLLLPSVFPSIRGLLTYSDLQISSVFIAMFLLSLQDLYLVIS